MGAGVSGEVCTRRGGGRLVGPTSHGGSVYIAANASLTRALRPTENKEDSATCNMQASEAHGIEHVPQVRAPAGEVPDSLLDW